MGFTETKRFLIAETPEGLADMNTFYGAGGNTDWLYDERPHLRVRLNANLAFPATPTTTIGIEWDAEDIDTDAMWDAGTAWKISINTSGLYLIAAQAVIETPWLGAIPDHALSLGANATGITGSQTKNYGRFNIGDEPNEAGRDASHCGTWVAPLEAGESLILTSSVSSDAGDVHTLLGSASADATDTTRLSVTFLRDFTDLLRWPD